MLLKKQIGFTLVEIAIVLLLISIILGYTIALFPRQQELKNYNALEKSLDVIVLSIIGFAQINGRLPCPAIPNSAGLEDYDAVNDDGCNNYGGFVPVNTLGLDGRVNLDNLLLDPWGNPYRYYVSNADFDGDGLSDFTAPGEMRDIGLIDSNDDGYIDLDGRYLICDAEGLPADGDCDGAAEVFGRYNLAGPTYAGAPFVLLSQGQNWGVAAPVNDELANIGASLTNTNLGLPLGPSTNEYRLKNVAGGETTFVRRTTGFADNYDDVVRWVSPNILFSKMIEAGQLP